MNIRDIPWFVRKTKVNFANSTIEELREAHRSDEDRITSRRLFGLIKLYEGRSVNEILSFMEISESAIQRWIKLFNEFGLEGLLARGEPGRKKSIVGYFQETIEPLLGNGSAENQEHWTAVKLHSTLHHRYGLQCSYSTILRMLHDNAYSRVIARPEHPNRDPVARQAFLEMLSQLDADSNNEIYFCDEAGFEGDPRPRAKWVKRGNKPACQRTGNHLRMSVIGAVATKSGELIFLIVPQTDTDVFQIFLDGFVKSTQDKNSQGKK